MVTEGELKLMEVASRHPTIVLLSSYCYWRLHSMSYQWPCASYLMNMPNLGIYETSCEAVLPLSKLLTMGYTTCSVNGAQHLDQQQEEKL